MSQPRIAVITGTSRGLGHEIALQLANAGWTVVAAQRSVPDDRGGNVRGAIKHVPVDLRDHSSGGSIDRLITYIHDTLPYMNMLINNAAICKPDGNGNVNSGRDLEHDEWADTLKVNFYAVMRLTTELLPLLRRAPSGIARVVCVSSGDGELVFFRKDIHSEFERLAMECETVRGLEEGVRRLVENILTSAEWQQAGQNQRQDIIFGGQMAYRFSKASVNAFVRMAARCLSRCPSSCEQDNGFVGFVAVCPGDIDTSMGQGHTQLIPVQKAARLMQRELAIHTGTNTVNNSFAKDTKIFNGAFVRYGKAIRW